MTKTEFMDRLRASLSECGVTDTREIMLDFEQHFEDGAAAGETEAQVCEKLGSPEEIAKQYTADGDYEATEKKAETSSADPFTKAETSGFGADPFTKTETSTFNNDPFKKAEADPQPQGFNVDVGKVIIILLVDLLVFTWAIPTLISLVCSLYGITVGIGGSGIVVFIAGILMNFMDTSAWLFTTLSPISTSLFGVVLMAATPLLVIGSIAATKGTINIFKHIINWHSLTFAGRKVCSFEDKEEWFK